MGSSEKTFRIGLVAPGGPMAESVARRARDVAWKTYGNRVELNFHPQCFLSSGHFAGDDRQRIDALVEVGNDPEIDAVWFARGGYGACRVAEAAIAQLGDEARRKTWLGYSDAGFLLAGLAKAGFPHVAHGPMPVDLVREDGEAAMERGLSWLVNRDENALEPGLDGRPSFAFNLTILSQLLGTPLEPDFTGRVLLLEDVGEYMYRIDRYFFHVTSNANVRRCAGIRLGRCSAVPKNDPDFGMDEDEVTRFWCERSGIAYLGRGDIGHDSDNKVVPFGEPAGPRIS
jgi:muramoyltetrapeptide carboxypeptidase